MVIQLFDANWQPVSNLIEASSRLLTRIRVNQATAFSFTFPSDSVKAADLDLAAHVLLLGRLPGRITSRRVVGGEVQIDGLTLEDRLNDIRTPRRWVGWNDRDLADVVRDLLRPFGFRRWSTQTDWQGAVEKVNVDLTTEPGSVLLATDPYLGVPRYRASGYIVLRAQLPATALPTGKWVRWTERVGSKTRIKVQTRAAATTAELAATPWGPEMEALHAEGVEENETKGVPVMDGGPWVDIRLNLYTDDRDTYDNDEHPTIMGFTPILDGVELIWREPPVIGEGSIPASTGVIVRDTEYNRVTHLRALVELCERYRHTFRIRLDGATPALDLAPSFGVDRSADVLLVNGENAVVELRDTDQETSASGSGGRRISVLHCWGAGSGADQLYWRIEDPALIEAIGVVEDDFEDTSITDLATLQARGQEEFERRRNPFTEAVVETTAAVLADAWLQDTVSVIDPASGTVAALEIREIQIDEDADSGELVRLGLGAEIVGLVDAVLAGRAKPTGIRPHVPPLHAPVLRAEGMHEAIRLTWTLVPGAESYDLEHSTDGTTWVLLASDVPALSYDHRGLVLGSVHWYRIYAKRAGVRSQASNVVRQVARDTVPPAMPVNVSAIGIALGIAVRWDKPLEPDYDHTEIHVSTTQGFEPDRDNWTTLVARVKGTLFEWTEGAQAGTTYYVRLVHVDDSGNASEPSMEVSATAGTLAGPIVLNEIWMDPTGLYMKPSDFAQPAMKLSGRMLGFWDINNLPAIGLGDVREMAQQLGSTMEYGLLFAQGEIRATEAVIRQSLSGGAVNSDKLEDGSITPDKLPDKRLTLNKLSDLICVPSTKDLTYELYANQSAYEVTSTSLTTMWTSPNIPKEVPGVRVADVLSVVFNWAFDRWRQRTGLADNPTAGDTYIELRRNGSVIWSNNPGTEAGPTRTEVTVVPAASNTFEIRGRGQYVGTWNRTAEYYTSDDYRCRVIGIKIFQNAQFSLRAGTPFEDTTRTLPTFQCGDTCQRTCQQTCQQSCQMSCEVSCQTASQVGACQGGCESTCQSNCQKSCQATCERTSQGGGGCIREGTPVTVWDPETKELREVPVEQLQPGMILPRYDPATDSITYGRLLELRDALYSVQFYRIHTDVGPAVDVTAEQPFDVWWDLGPRGPGWYKLQARHLQPGMKMVRPFDSPQRRIATITSVEVVREKPPGQPGVHFWWPITELDGYIVAGYGDVQLKQ